MNTKKTIYRISSAVLGSLFMVLLLLGETAMAIEEPAFDVIETNGDLEFRAYAPYVIAETLVTDARSRTAASNTGFMRLFAYISGENTGQTKIEMTAPVIQTDPEARGKKIEMTAPVQQTETDDGWLVAFVLPLDYTMDTAPMPDNPAINLRQVSARTMAVLRFSGRWTEKNVEKHQKELIDQLKDKELTVIGQPEFAAYNAPFTLPFLRRNEIMVEVLHSSLKQHH